MFTASLYLKNPSLILGKSIKILYFSKKDKPRIKRIYSTLYIIERNVFFKVKGHLLRCIPISMQLSTELATLLTLMPFSAVV